ncbi:hypothetical protein I4Q36_03395 [Tuanshanicoccus lijuaniae]|uniref:hypothetical protein n=1 Tax=Aerococcaceae bacterium zg-1292 TaxID=2774330 RepID=UPI001938DBF2|nr:hypothetical protein [Aerococcaceae bacterium zg-BR9]QQA37747.1 hypothetical protein I4Q36_03395 [Aerococcaceae bacterium zg-1292]
MFSLEGKLYRGLAVIWHLIMVNILVMVFSLPIITLGASITAGITIIEPSSGNIFIQFWETFKTKWLSSLPILAINVVSLYFYFMFDMTFLASSLKIIYYVFILFLLIFNVNCYVILAKFADLHRINIFRYSFMISILSLVKTIWIPIVWVLLVLKAYHFIGLLLNIMLVSLPLYVHIKMINKEVKMIEKFLSKDRKEG